MLRLVHEDAYLVPAVGPYRFPIEETEHIEPLSNRELTQQLLGEFGSNPNNILEAVEEMSRRMEDLAREFGCSNRVGDDPDDDSPRAA